MSGDKMMSDDNSRKMKYLEIVTIGQGPDLAKGMLTVTIALKDDKGESYFTHLVTRDNYAHSTRKTIERLRRVKFPPVPDSGNEIVKINQTK